MLSIVCGALALQTGLHRSVNHRASRPAMQLLGADGQPLGGSGGNADPSTPSGLVGADGRAMSDELMPEGPMVESKLGLIPEDLADFDPDFDPLAAPRPAHDLAAASGRRDEAVWGAVAPETADAVAEWAALLRSKGIQRVMGLFSVEEAAARGRDGTPQGYMRALVEEGGFAPQGVSLLDPRQPGARDVMFAAMRDAATAREPLCVHCVDGTSLTGVAMADWLLTDYIGGDNFLEACDALAARKRLAGVERRVPAETLEAWIQQGHL
jgi:hypothetical protein